MSSPPPKKSMHPMAAQSLLQCPSQLCSVLSVSTGRSVEYPQYCTPPLPASLLDSVCRKTEHTGIQDDSGFCAKMKSFCGGCALDLRLSGVHISRQNYRLCPSYPASLEDLLDEGAKECLSTRKVDSHEGSSGQSSQGDNSGSAHVEQNSKISSVSTMQKACIMQNKWLKTILNYAGRTVPLPSVEPVCPTESGTRVPVDTNALWSTNKRRQSTPEPSARCPGKHSRNLFYFSCVWNWT